MKRRYTAEFMYDRVQKLTATIPGAVYGADIMAGFPTESDEAFQDSILMIEKLGIAFPHVFSYSDRPGVPAERIPKQVPHPVRKQRTRLLIEAGERVRDELFRQKLENRHEATVLVEKVDSELPHLATGRSAEYLPILIHGGTFEPGNLIKVQISGIDGSRLIARPV